MESRGSEKPEEMQQQCGHEWISYSEPPMRAVTGRQCKRCGLVEPRGEVDRAMDYLESDNAWPDYEPPGGDTRDSADVLIAEVRRLRELSSEPPRASLTFDPDWTVIEKAELSRLRADLDARKEILRRDEEHMAQQSAKLARVGVLPAKWSEASYSSDHLACLRDLEDALKD